MTVSRRPHPAPRPGRVAQARPPSGPRPGAKRSSSCSAGPASWSVCCCSPSGWSARSSRCWACRSRHGTPFDDFDLARPAPAPPSPAHLLGTDRLGRDLLSRVLYGARDVFIVAPLAAVISRHFRDHPRAGHGLLPGTRRRHHQPHRRGLPGAAGHHGGAPDPGRPRVILPITSSSASSACCSRRSSPGPSARPCSPSASSTT